jgi:hypothetical protein
VAVPKRYEDFSNIYDLSTDALLKRGKAENYRFTTVREGDYLSKEDYLRLLKEFKTPNLRPDLTDGLPMMKPEFRDPHDLEMNPPKPGSRFPKPRPPGF